MKNRMFALGLISLSLAAGARFVSPDAAVWFGLFGGILLVLS